MIELELTLPCDSKSMIRLCSATLSCASKSDLRSFEPPSEFRLLSCTSTHTISAPAIAVPNPHPSQPTLSIVPSYEIETSA